MCSSLTCHHPLEAARKNGGVVHSDVYRTESYEDWGLHPIIEHFTLEDIIKRLHSGKLEGTSCVSLEIPDHAVFTCLIAPSTKEPFQTVFNSAKDSDIC